MSKPNQPSKPRQLIRKLITIHSAPGRSRQAVISVIPIAVSLVTMGLIVSPTHAAMGMIGAMGALAGNNNAPLSRARILFGVGTATIFSQCLGLMSVQIEWLLPIILASWSLIVIWVWHALQLGPPGPLNILFAAAFGTYMASRGWTVSTVFTSTVPSFLIAAIVSMIIILASPHRPVRAAVKKAENAVNAYCEPDDDADSHEVARLRSAAHAAIHLAWWAYNDGHSSGVDNPSEMSELSDLRARLITAHMRLEHELRLEAFLGRCFPAGPCRLDSAWSPQSQLPAANCAGTGIATDDGGTARGNRCLLRLSAYDPVTVRPSILGGTERPHHDSHGRNSLGHDDPRHSPGARYRRRPRPVPGDRRIRPSGWVKIGLIIVFLWTMQALVTRNYGLACIFITCFALFMTPLTKPGQMYQLAQDRIVETIVGLTIGIVTIHIVGRRAPVLLVRSQYRRTLRSMMPVLRSLSQGRTKTPQAQIERNQMVHELIQGSALLSATCPDAPQALQDWSKVDRTVTETGYDLLSVCWHTGNGPVPWARRLLADIAIFITGLPPISSQNLDAHSVAEEMEKIRMDMVTSLPGVK